MLFELTAHPCGGFSGAQLHACLASLCCMHLKDCCVAGAMHRKTQPAQQPRPISLAACRACRQQVAGSPRASQGMLLEGPGRPLLPLRVDVQRVSTLQEELGAGEGVSALLLRSATAGENGGPGVVQRAEPTAGSFSPAASLLLSPPNSPRRRQTTFGATLDFVETLCQASSSLTAFQREWTAVARDWACCCHQACKLQSPPELPAAVVACRSTSAGCWAHREPTPPRRLIPTPPARPQPHPPMLNPPPAADDRQWALRRALQQINVEIEKASRNGVAIWFPMGEADLRVVRLAPRESRLLNSRCVGLCSSAPKPAPPARPAAGK